MKMAAFSHPTQISTFQGKPTSTYTEKAKISHKISKEYGTVSAIS